MDAATGYADGFGDLGGAVAFLGCFLNQTGDADVIMFDHGSQFFPLR